MEKRKVFAALDKNEWTIYGLLSVLKDLWFFNACMLLWMIFWVVSLWEMIWIETIRMVPPTTISLHKLDCGERSNKSSSSSTVSLADFFSQFIYFTSDGWDFSIFH